MSHQVTPQEIEAELANILAQGVTGYPSDYLSWLNMTFALKYETFSHNYTKEAIQELLEKMITTRQAKPGEFDKKEYASNHKIKQDNHEQYTILGAHEYSPIQYLRTRLETFLKYHSIDEMAIMDISIGTVEAIENAVKYGDGRQIDIEYYINSQNLFTIHIINKIKDFEPQGDIDSGKYSSNITLMRGVMVMQKLFDNLDLSILDETKQAKLSAEKNLA